MLLKKYTPNWVNNFTDIKNTIAQALHGIENNIEHVGSTAVPMLDAKPIIDIDIVYYTPSDFEKIKAGLQALGYFHNGNQGIQDRDVFKRTGKSNNYILDTLQHHLYVCPHTSKALERHILTRNILRNNERARLQYQQLKYNLAAKANQDRKKYAALKEVDVNIFFDTIIAEQKTAESIK
jgi:GrpB-like predicted nucleotidyltransferase (UPF0157 family)